MKKEKLIEVINELPSEFELDELIEKLILIEKIELGLQQVAEGKTRSHQEVKKIVQTLSS